MKEITLKRYKSRRKISIKSARCKTKSISKWRYHQIFDRHLWAIIPSIWKPYHKLF